MDNTKYNDVRQNDVRSPRQNEGVPSTLVSRSFVCNLRYACVFGNTHIRAFLLPFLPTLYDVPKISYMQQNHKSLFIRSRNGYLLFRTFLILSRGNKNARISSSFSYLPSDEYDFLCPTQYKLSFGILSSSFFLLSMLVGLQSLKYGKGHIQCFHYSIPFATCIQIF